MLLADVIERGDNSNLRRLLIKKMLHDIASPLNAVMMGMDIIESGYDASMVGYAKDGVNKMAGLLALFRLLWNVEHSDVSILEIKKNFGTLCNFSITSDNPHINLEIAQLLICTVYAVLCAAAKVKEISCNISDEKIQIVASAQEIFCSFEADVPTEKNIFQCVALKLSETLQRRLVAENMKDKFIVTF